MNSFVKLLLIMIFLQIFIPASSTKAVAANVIEFYPPGESSINGNPITLTFNGTIYTDSWWFDEITTGSTTTGKFIAGNDEKFIISVVNTYQTGTVQDILNLWSPSDQSQIQADLSDTQLLTARQNFFKNAQYSALMVKMMYGAYTIFLIQHTGPIIGSTIQEFPIVNINGNYYLTNRLQSDPIFVYIVDKYISALTFKQRAQ